jgi:hypothetical protein
MTKRVENGEDDVGSQESKQEARITYKNTAHFPNLSSWLGVF